MYHSHRPICRQPRFPVHGVVLAPQSMQIERISVVLFVLFATSRKSCVVHWDKIPSNSSGVSLDPHTFRIKYFSTFVGDFPFTSFRTNRSVWKSRIWFRSFCNDVISLTPFGMFRLCCFVCSLCFTLPWRSGEMVRCHTNCKG